MPPEEHKLSLYKILQEYVDIFAWSHENVPGIPFQILSHYHIIESIFKPIKKKVEALQSREACNDVRRSVQAPQNELHQ
ncbi:hypothetical protein ACOSQ3_009868 [Xanthoceras sorbifolium]